MKRAWYEHTQRAPAAERTVDGVVFDSKSEARRWAELTLLARAGEIVELERQVRYPLVASGRPVKIRSKGFPNGRPCVYTLDFRYFDRRLGKPIFEEWKGHDDPASRLRRAIIEALYDIEITVTGPASVNTPPRVVVTVKPL